MSDRSDRERELLRYGGSLEEIGSHFGMTRERVRQIEARALDKLREVCFSDPFFKEFVEFGSQPEIGMFGAGLRRARDRTRIQRRSEDSPGWPWSAWASEDYASVDILMAKRDYEMKHGERYRRPGRHRSKRFVDRRIPTIDDWSL
jgi:hypothetical protein